MQETEQTDTSTSLFTVSIQPSIASLAPRIAGLPVPEAAVLRRLHYQSEIAERLGYQNSSQTQAIHKIPLPSSEPFATKEGVLWEGLEVPMNTIKERYQINWKPIDLIALFDRIHRNFKTFP